MSVVGEALSSQHRSRREEHAAVTAWPRAHSRGCGFGFWLFLLSDILIFAALFAAYAVLSGETAGGPAGAPLVR